MHRSQWNQLHCLLSVLQTDILLRCFQSNYNTLYGSDSSVSVDIFREHEPGRREEIEGARFQKIIGKVKSFKEKLKIYSGEDRAVLMHFICNYKSQVGKDINTFSVPATSLK